MCLYPKLIKNKKYTSNKKNGGFIPPVLDNRVLYVPVGCGECIECMKQKARNWQVRMLEDIKDNTNGKFYTLTFSNESIMELAADLPKVEGYALDNEIARLAVHRFLGRWRKKYKKSVRHWFVTELGHEGTENIHLHGIIWTDKSKIDVEERWTYGHSWVGTYVNECTVSYITKYIVKQDVVHKGYKPKVLTSPGIGKRYIDSMNAKSNKFKDGDTKEFYRTNTGHKISLPIYYRNKIYTDEEKEKLWLEKLDSGCRYVCGEKVTNYREYWSVLEYRREENSRLGYGGGEVSWERNEYEEQRRVMLQKERIEKSEIKESKKVIREKRKETKLMLKEIREMIKRLRGERQRRNALDHSVLAQDILDREA